MKNQIALLIEIQKIDQEVRTLNTKKQTLPEKAAELDESFRSGKERIDEERTGLEGLSKLHREKESELKAGQEKLRKARERLHEVKTNKEYQAMLTEIETIEKTNGKIEEEILLLYDRIDERKGALKTHEKEFEAVRATYETERRKIEAEMASLDGALQEQKARFDSLIGNLEPDLRRRYEMIKVRRNGVAVVAVRKGVCCGCNMNLPPQLYNELQRSDQIHCCPNCNRLLYWDESANGE
ncbi:MAG: putative zinc ribbon domain protein [Syntrophaceae bacterium PtaB.Bin038]|nr:MAG: putative zinc ribbon domain protein [Syntrophaceae bacterium PtaB.Bin038]